MTSAPPWASCRQRYRIAKQLALGRDIKITRCGPADRRLVHRDDRGLRRKLHFSQACPHPARSAAPARGHRSFPRENIAVRRRPHDARTRKIISDHCALKPAGVLMEASAGAAKPDCARRWATSPKAPEIAHGYPARNARSVAPPIAEGGDALMPLLGFALIGAITSATLIAQRSTLHDFIADALGDAVVACLFRRMFYKLGDKAHNNHASYCLCGGWRKHSGRAWDEFIFWSPPPQEGAVASNAA